MRLPIVFTESRLARLLVSFLGIFSIWNLVLSLWVTNWLAANEMVLSSVVNASLSDTVRNAVTVNRSIGLSYLSVNPPINGSVVEPGAGYIRKASTSVSNNTSNHCPPARTPRREGASLLVPKGVCTIYTPMRLDRSGQAIQEMLTAHACAHYWGFHYGGACSEVKDPHH